MTDSFWKTIFKSVKHEWIYILGVIFFASIWILENIMLKDLEDSIRKSEAALSEYRNWNSTVKFIESSRFALFNMKPSDSLSEPSIKGNRFNIEYQYGLAMSNLKEALLNLDIESTDTSYKDDARAEFSKLRELQEFGDFYRLRNFVDQIGMAFGNYPNAIDQKQAQDIIFINRRKLDSRETKYRTAQIILTLLGSIAFAVARYRNYLESETQGKTVTLEAAEMNKLLHAISEAGKRKKNQN